VPKEYWEYVLIDTYFRGNYPAYLMTPEYMIKRIYGFKSIESETG